MSEQPDHTQSEVSSFDGQMQVCDDIRAALAEVAACTADSSDDDVVRSAAADLIDLITAARMLSDDSGPDAQTSEIIDFCRTEAMPALAEDNSEKISRILSTVNTRWAGVADILAPEERFQPAANSLWPEADETTGFEHSGGEGSADTDSGEVSVGADLAKLLQTLGSEPAAELSASVPPARASDSLVNSGMPTGQSFANGVQSPEPESIDDPELAAAFADDAVQCLSEMESSLLQYESGTDPAESLRAFCRQLHTLKGAAGTVGLTGLATFLHELEEYVESASAGSVDVDRLLAGIDAVRNQLGASEASETTATPIAAAASNASDAGTKQRPNSPPAGRGRDRIGIQPATGAGSGRVSETPAETESFVRIEASRLDRLMDLLAELVMLRNRRDTAADTLRTIHDELNLCAARTRTATTTFDHALTRGESGPVSARTDVGEDSPFRTRLQPSGSSQLLARSLDEIAQDTSALSRSLVEVSQPLAEDNAAVSQLIGRFRQELMELRRVPVAGLFRRLQRSVREAAREEGKTVELITEGEGSRADRAIQERLFEPLLHLVRNAVSHGVETPDKRSAAGKPEAGRIRLAARSDASVLTIEVSDDGKGLDDEALEQRGRELGLLSGPGSIPVEEIRRLIFHPGFSTARSVSRISGRGVGMDVVDNWVRRLRGRIEVDSLTGSGTTFRLRIPLRSAVEHAMVVRTGGQLFALPMHMISATSGSGRKTEDRHNGTSERPYRICRIPQVRANGLGKPCRIELRRTAAAADDTGMPVPVLEVDSVVGVEEVVVRPMPPLLQHNDLFSGVTLSGRAEIVLLLDVGRLIEMNDAADSFGGEATEQAHDAGASGVTAGDQPCVLVTDDSVVVRRALKKRLSATGCVVREAADGREALRILRSEEVNGLVTDLDMPVMGGAELIQQVRRSEQLRSLPIVVLTSRDEASIPEAVKSSSPAAVLAKPIGDDTARAILTAFATADCELVT